MLDTRSICKNYLHLYTNNKVLENVIKTKDIIFNSNKMHKVSMVPRNKSNKKLFKKLLGDIKKLNKRTTRKWKWSSLMMRLEVKVRS